MNLYAASKQWATRPPDERFSTINEMLEACREYADKACLSTVNLKTLKAVANDDEVLIQGQSGLKARLTYWAFGQLASKTNAPAAYLRVLPPNLAADCLNYGISKIHKLMPNFEVLFHSEIVNQSQDELFNSQMLLRAFTSAKYTRFWNYEVVEQIQNLFEKGWRVPPARPAFKNQPGARKATEDDVLDVKDFLSIKVGDLIAPAGLYASDHDMFAFLINEKNRIEDGTEHGLSRGVFFENSEVGDRSLRCTTFLYRHVCGNHIVWDASNVAKLSIRHVGKVHKKFTDFLIDLKKYTNSGAKGDEKKIQSYKKKKIASTKEDVINKLFRQLYKNVTAEQLEQAYDLTEANQPVDGDPNTVWGMTQGLSRLSQNTSFTDERTNLDRAAGKILRIRF